MSERCDLLSRMTWLMCQTVVKHVLLMKAKRSTLEMRYFVRERKDPLLIMTWVMSPWWWTRRTWTSEFQDYHIPLWSMRRVPAFENWFRKLRTTQIDMLFNKICDKINQFQFRIKTNDSGCGQHRIMWIARDGTQTWCTACLSYWNTRLIYCTCGHFLHEETGVNRKFINYTMGFLRVLEYVIKKGRPRGHRCVKKPGDKEDHLDHQLKKKCKKQKFQGIHDMTDSYEIMSSVSEWLNIIEMKIFVDDGMLLRMKITLTIWPHKNTSTIRTNGGFIQISKVLILCHWGIDLFSSKHCLLCNDYNKKQKKNHKCLLVQTKPKQWEAQGSSSTWWNWQGSWWTPYHSESQEGDAPSIEWTVRPVTRSIWQASSKKDFHELNLFCYRLIVYSWRRSTVTDGRCKYNTSNDPFSKCESQQEIRVQV